MMHIAFLTSEYPHPRVKSAAGIGTSIKNLVEALVKKNIRVTMFIYGQEENQVFTEDKLTYHLIADRKYRFGKWYFYRKFLKRYIENVVRVDKIDLIEAADWTGITAFMKFKIPLVIRFHGSDTYFCNIEKRKQKWKNYFFEKRAVQNADALIAPTKFAGELSRKLFDVSKKEYAVINYGLNLKKFINITPQEFSEDTLLYIGSIIRKKGVFELPIIFRLVREKNPNCRLILIGADCQDVQTGSASSWELLKGMFSSDDLQYVNYNGKIPYLEVQEHIQNTNVCVIPTFAETLGMVTIESMAMQKCVVNSNIGWANELMEDGKSGFLVHPKNHELYATRILQIISNKNLTVQMGMEARRFVESNFNIEDKASENINFYKRICSDVTNRA